MEIVNDNFWELIGWEDMKEEVNHGFGDASPIKVWYAVDMAETVGLFYSEKPERFYREDLTNSNGNPYGYWKSTEGKFNIEINGEFPAPVMSWEDEPIEVEVTFKIV